MPSTYEYLIGVGGTVAGIALSFRLYWYYKLGHISTGQKRRSLYPLHVGIGPGACEGMKASDLKIQRELYTLKSGEQCFCQVIRCTTREPSYILVYLHGYAGHSDMYFELAARLARAGGLVVMPDLPSHGRSDGLLTYVPDWFEWVDKIWELIELVVLPLKSSQVGIKKLFVSGISLGGGLAACLTVQRPTFFDGMVLLVPMLFVADDVKPPKIVQDIFKTILGPFKLTWPLTPSSSVEEFDFRIPEQGVRWSRSNPFSMQGLKPRIASAKEMAFVFPEWMATRLSEVRLPFLVMHGKSDKVTDHKVSMKLYEEAKSTDKELKLYDGAYHCELVCCLPSLAKMIGTEWLPEQSKQTEECVKHMSEWLAARA